jgi:hypothetical protein
MAASVVNTHLTVLLVSWLMRYKSSYRGVSMVDLADWEAALVDTALRAIEISVRKIMAQFGKQKADTSTSTTYVCAPHSRRQPHTFGKEMGKA